MPREPSPCGAVKGIMITSVITHLKDTLEPSAGGTGARTKLDLRVTDEEAWLSLFDPESGEKLGEVMLEVRGGALIAHVSDRNDVDQDPTQSHCLAVLQEPLAQENRDRFTPEQVLRALAARRPLPVADCTR